MLPAANAYNVTDESRGHLRLVHRGHPYLSRLEHSRLCHPSLPGFAAFRRPPPAEYNGFEASGQNLRTRIVLLVPAHPFAHPRPQR
ncbi:MAG: hypothetical protein CL936_02870 [Deltaproteobacteria bacterium]|nr:hypothetical protein [Deltaproteobacteria bacterium]